MMILTDNSDNINYDILGALKTGCIYRTNAKIIFGSCLYIVET